MVGGGPAGLAPLLAAHRGDRLSVLLESGVAVVEQGRRLGGGSLGREPIKSDSSGRTFVDCLGRPPANRRISKLDRLANHSLARGLEAAGDGAVPLRDASAFLDLVGGAIAEELDRHPACAALTGHRALAAHQAENGWEVRVQDIRTGTQRTLSARTLLLATGADQPLDRLAREEVGGCNLAAQAGHRLMQSGDVLAEGGFDEVTRRLAGKARPQVVIAGGSTSAVSVAHALLHRLPGVHFGEGGITLLHRRPLRVTYADAEAALAEGYVEWTPEDVCPVSGRVFRFAGFRLDSRELVMQARGIGGRPPEPRLKLHRLLSRDQAAARLVESADLVIAALGYRPRALSLHGRSGALMPLGAHMSAQAPLVDDRCRVLDDAGAPIDGVFGIGLAAGFVPRGKLGGEPSFRGQANGLWLWQHDVGDLIVDAAIGRLSGGVVIPGCSAPANLNTAVPERLAAEGD